MSDFRNITGAVFDMDGTILDSMGMWQDIDRRYLARFGKEAPADLALIRIEQERMDAEMACFASILVPRLD